MLLTCDSSGPPQHHRAFRACILNEENDPAHRGQENERNHPENNGGGERGCRRHTGGDEGAHDRRLNGPQPARRDLRSSHNLGGDERENNRCHIRVRPDCPQANEEAEAIGPPVHS